MTAAREAVVQVRDLVKTYGPVRAVDGVDLDVRRGEVLGVLGPNGAGKTTTLRILLGLVAPSAGSVTVLGRGPGEPGALARVGALVEGPAFYPYLSGRDNLRVVARYAGSPRSSVSAALRAVDLADRAGDRYGTYSMGMKQRLGVAAALLKDPKLVVLDEPTNGLDPAGMRDMRALVRDLAGQGRTVLLSSHLLGEVQQVCDRVVVIDRGRVVSEGSVDSLRAAGDLVVRATPVEVAVAALRELPAVGDVRPRDGALVVSVDDADTALVTRALVAAGAAVTELRRDTRELEDVFFDLTTRPEEPR